jgi:hypothetical protein
MGVVVALIVAAVMTAMVSINELAGSSGSNHARPAPS